MSGSDILLHAEAVSRRFDGIVAVDRVDLTVHQREIVGLIGPNGSGKSTMVNLVSGDLAVNTGRITFDGRDITALKPWRRARAGIVRSFQMIRVFRSMTIEENMLAAVHTRMQQPGWASVLNLPASRAEEQRLRERARDILAWFELDQFAGRSVGALSIGQQRMVELARGVLAEPKLFVLDEPAAGLSPPNVDRLIALVKRMRDEFGIAILLVEHDMRVVRDLCDTAVVLDSGKLIARGRPDDVVNDPTVVEAYIGTGWKRRAKA